MYQDKTLVCKDCGAEFVFTAGEPQRCKNCRNARKNAGKPQREMHTAICAKCGKEAKVPFEPTSDKPVYCSECYAAMRESK